MSMSYAEALAIAMISGLAASVLTALLQIRASRSDERTKQLREAYATWAAAYFAYADSLVESADVREKLPAANREYNQARHADDDAKAKGDVIGWERLVGRTNEAVDELRTAAKEAENNNVTTHLKIYEARFRVLLLEQNSKILEKFEAVLPEEIIPVTSKAEAERFKMLVGGRIEEFCKWYAGRG